MRELRLGPLRLATYLPFSRTACNTALAHETVWGQEILLLMMIVWDL
jgi:hypothetical protein